MEDKVEGNGMANKHIHVCQFEYNSQVSTQHQLLYVIWDWRNQEPTQTRLLGPTEPEIKSTQMNKEVQDNNLEIVQHNNLKQM